MHHVLRSTCLALVGLALAAVSARADGYGPIVTYYPPSPAVVATTYYAPAVYTPPVVYRAYYAAPVYYTPPVVAAAPVVSYAAPVSVSTYRYGILPRSQVTTYSYGAAVPVVGSYYVPLYR